MSTAEAQREFMLGDGSLCRAVGGLVCTDVRADTTVSPDLSSRQQLSTRPFLPFPSRSAYCLLAVQTSGREQASKQPHDK